MATEYFSLGGGLDQVTPALSIKPGRCIVGVNYECDLNGGYRRTGGYERLDGRPPPSGAVFYGIRIRGAYAADEVRWAVGQTMTGGTSGAMAVIASVEALAVIPQDGLGQGTIEGVPLSGDVVSDPYLLVVTFLSATGIFVRNETVSNGSTTGMTETAQQELYAVTPETYSAVLAQAQDVRRAMIQSVPGVGPVRGVFEFNGAVYAMRDFDQSTKRLYRATPTGWQLFVLGRIVNFASGTQEVFVGDVVTDVASGNAEVLGVVLVSGSYDDGDAAGYFVTTNGITFANADTIKVDGVSVAVASGPSSAQTIPAGGRLKTVEWNFYGHTSFVKIYGCDGVGKAFQFDGSGYVPISTGMALDAPTHIAAHRNYLWLGFPGGSLQHSSLGDPLSWDPLLGAAEFGVGDEITGLIYSTEALAVLCRDRAYMLYGASDADFDLRLVSPDAGAVENTVQNLGRLIFLDDRGITSLEASQAFGNFAGATLSDDIKPLLNNLVGHSRFSMIQRERGLYRLFLDDGSAISLTVRSAKPVGFMTQRFGFVAWSGWSGEDSTGQEMILVGGDDGFVYQLERGPSFDGEPIQHSLRLPFWGMKTPRQKKRFRDVVIELVSPLNIKLSLQPDFSYGTPDIPPSDPIEVGVDGGGTFWGSPGQGPAIWSGQVVAEARVAVDGTGTNISILIFGNQISESHTLQGCLLRYDMRGPKR